MSADNQAAIVANGGIAVVGTGSENSFYQGLLYAKGADGVAVVNSTVLGTVISAGKQAPTKIERSTVAFTKSSTHIDLDLGWTGYDPSTGIKADYTDGSGAVVKQTLKLAPILGADGSAILEPKPKDYLAAGIKSLSSDAFTLESANGKNFSSSTPPAVRTALGAKGFILDPGSKIKTAVDELAPTNAEHAIFQALLTTVVNLSSAKPESESTKFKLDLNQFLKTSDRLRIVWRS